MPKPTTVLTFNSAVMTPELSSIIYGSQVTERYRFELLNNANVSKGFLNCVLEGGSLEYNYLADIKRRCGFNVAELNNFNMIDFYTDRVKIYYELYSRYSKSWLSFPLGVYALSSGSRVANKGVITRAVEGFDLTLVLKRKKHLSRFVVPAGSDPIVYVRNLLEDAGLFHAIENNPDVVNDLTVAERSFDPGAEYISTINELLAMINYGSLYFDNNGIAVAHPYTTPQDRLAEIDYITNDKSIVGEGAALELSVFDVPNIVQVVVSQPDRPVLVGIATNTNPDSPTSTVSTGEERVYVSSDNEDVTTQDQANSKARNLLAQMSQIYETITFNSAVVPLHGENNILNIEHSILGVSALYSETEWKLSLKAGEMMSHTARRVVQV